MSNRQRDAAYLLDMLSRARLVVELAGTTTQDRLAELDPTTAAIERWLEVVGEAARNVSIDFKTAHPDIPWQKIVATRHVLAHEYGNINYERIWRIVTEHLPELIRQLEPLVPPPPPDPEP